MFHDVTCERAPNPQSNNSHHLMKTQIKSILVQTFSIINLIYQLTLFCLSFLCQFEWMYEEIYSDFNKKFFSQQQMTLIFHAIFFPACYSFSQCQIDLSWFILSQIAINFTLVPSHSLVLCINVYYDIEMRKFIFDFRSFYCFFCW